MTLADLAPGQSARLVAAYDSGTAGCLAAGAVVTREPHASAWYDRISACVRVDVRDAQGEKWGLPATVEVAP